MVVDVWIAVAAVIVSVAAVFIAIFTYRHQKASHERNGLLEVFKMLNTPSHRKARNKVYCLYKEYERNQDSKIFYDDEVRGSVEIVRADFDQIGTLLLYHGIQRKGLLEEYGQTAYACRKSLKPHIDYERKKREFPPYMFNFEWLKNEAWKYWHTERDLDKMDLDKVPIFCEEESTD